MKEMEAFKFMADFCLKHMTLDYYERFQEAYDLMRRAAVDAAAKRARQEGEETQRIRPHE